ncbi:hypothetical protein COOONC_24596 [Cooperia oncophora]
MSSDQAKIEFLTVISKKDSFGSAFFPPSIRKGGVHLYNSETKTLITQYPFNVICNWTSGNTYFNMTVGNGIRGNEGKKLLLDTTMGYKMDDLITSYISVLISGQNNNSITRRNESII